MGGERESFVAIFMIFSFGRSDAAAQRAHSAHSAFLIDPEEVIFELVVVVVVVVYVVVALWVY